MEELVQWIGYFIVSMALLGIVLVAIRLLPFVSTVAVTFALLQWVLPNMALLGKEGPKNALGFAALMSVAIFSAILDLASILKRLPHFWDIPRKPCGKD